MNVKSREWKFIFNTYISKASFASWRHHIWSKSCWCVPLPCTHLWRERKKRNHYCASTDCLPLQNGMQTSQNAGTTVLNTFLYLISTPTTADSLIICVQN